MCQLSAFLGAEPQAPLEEELGGGPDAWGSDFKSLNEKVLINGLSSLFKKWGVKKRSRPSRAAQGPRCPHGER